MTVNDDLFDRAVRHAMLLEGVKDTEVKRISQFISGPFRKDLEETLTKYYSPSLGRTQRRDLLSSLRANSANAFRTNQAYMIDTLGEVGGMSAQFASDSLQQHLPFAYEPAMPGPNMIRAIVRNEPMHGKLVTQWFKELNQDTQNRIAQQINLGLAQGNSVQDMIRRIRGTRSANYADGVLAATRRNVEAVVRTQMTHVSNRARNLVYEQNEDVIKGVQYVATLDARTTDVCASLDGKVFKPTEGPRPPLHIRCRSTTVPITKSWKELGEEFKSERIGKLPEAKLRQTRAAMTGQVPARTTYSSWLKKQSPEFQDAVLGPKRAKLFREGRVNLTRFVNFGTFPPSELSAKSLLELERKLGPAKARRTNPQLKEFLVNGSPTRRPPIKPLPPPEPPTPPAPPPPPPTPTPESASLMNGESLRSLFMQQNAAEIEKLRRHTDRLAALVSEKEALIAANKSEGLLKSVLPELQRLEQSIRTQKSFIEYESAQLRTKLHELLEVPKGKRLRSRGERGAFRDEHGGTFGKNSYVDGKIDEATDWINKHFTDDAIRMDLYEQTAMNEWRGGRWAMSGKDELEDIAAMAKEGDEFVFRKTMLDNGGRAYCHPEKGICVNASTDVKVIIHEMMHSIEDVDMQQLRASASFLKRRARAANTQSEGLSDIRKLQQLENAQFKPTEVAFRDNFDTTYTGKIYRLGDELCGTEVLSIGVEEMYHNPIAFMLRDPDYFDHIVDRMRGLVGRNFQRNKSGYTDDALKIGKENTGAWWGSGGVK